MVNLIVDLKLTRRAQDESLPVVRNKITTPDSAGRLATLACLVEVAAPKPGNVHPAAAFDDLTCADFVASAIAMQPAFDAVGPGARLGTIVREATAAMLAACGTNAHLGTILLLAPLAMVRADESYPAGLKRVLTGLDERDAADVYTAIRDAQPGGVGTSPQDDIAGPAPRCLITAMRQAEHRDRVAAQYANGFDDVLGGVVPQLERGLAQGWPLTDAIVHAHISLMQRHPDSLIARKCGAEVAQQSAALAGEVLAAGVPGDGDYTAALGRLDGWLRGDGHRRNPGTTADLIAAGIFVALRTGVIDTRAAEAMTAALLAEG